MKLSQCLVVLVLLGVLFTSCKKSDLIHEGDFERSYQKWLSFKDASGNTYRYQVSGGSWVGIGWQTIITVTGGKVTQRNFKYLIPVNGPEVHIPEEEMEWTENENEINSHEYSAADGVTLDSIYDRARTNWLLRRGNAKTYFEAKNNGLISSCGYIENGCQDDCFVGINIDFIKWSVKPIGL